MFTVHFAVSVPFALHEELFVFVSGSHEKLGSWDTAKALRLSKGENGQWTGNVNLGVETVRFRYFIGYYLQSEASKEPVLAICKWETHLTPRCVMPPVESSKTRVCRANLSDVFGFSGGREFISDGWVLTDEMNQIMLSVSGAALKFYKHKHVQQNYRLKVLPFDMRNKFDVSALEDEEDPSMADDEQVPPPALPSHSPTEIATLTQDQEVPKFREQEECGELFHNSLDYYMFRTQSVAVEFLSFRIEVYSGNSNALVAQGYALPSALHDTYGRTSVPLLTKKGLPVGKIYFGYLFIRPLRLPHPKPTMHNCYAKHWKKRTTLEVGHRGMGNSYTKCAVARENTLHSLNAAAKAGADFVEFDVHLTKDKVPIVFHDFHVMVSVAKRSAGASAATDSESDDGKKAPNEPLDFYQLAVKDLKLNQLRLLHLDHVKHASGQHCYPPPSAQSSLEKSDSGSISHQRVTGAHDEAEEHRPFPTLVEAFQNVSPEVGFNIEIKYPQLLADGQNECDNFFERNEFVDIVLAEVLNQAQSSNRRIVFSSFDPDICTMVSAKQKKYPMLFLCLGDSTRHTQYADERTRTSMTAVKFAYATGLMGVNFNSEDLLRDPSPVAKAKELGLVSFVWGDELVERKNVDFFKRVVGVEGVIYDRIGESESRTNVFTLEKAMKAALFATKSSSSLATSPVPPRCNSHNQLNASQNAGARVRSTSSAWAQQQQNGADQQGQSSGTSGTKSRMFSIGEQESVEFPVIRRHNSSHVGTGMESLQQLILDGNLLRANGGMFGALKPPMASTSSEV